MSKTKIERLEERKKALSDKIRHVRKKSLAAARLDKKQKEAVLGRHVLAWLLTEDPLSAAIKERLAGSSLTQSEKVMFSL